MSEYGGFALVLSVWLVLLLPHPMLLGRVGSSVRGVRLL